ncbi:transposase, partial [Streptomyces sp. NPDC006798]|uniref:transposase n=1 Tax=Streptomyces sp. NPDC006798 TaxID=3155462 RepID=UPI0033F7DC3A
MAKVAGRFARVEPRTTARAFVAGLLSDVERKNCWSLAEHCGHRHPDAMQRLLRSARWDADAVRAGLRDAAAAKGVLFGLRLMHPEITIVRADSA